MRNITRLKTLALLIVLAVLLSALPSLARGAPRGPLHPKSEAGLMPPAYILGPNEPVLFAAAPIPFLKPPVNTPSGGWAQVLAAADVAGDRRAEALVGTAQYFDPLNDRRVHVFGWNGARFDRLQRLPIWSDPQAALVADMNLDGRPDLALALPGSDRLALYTRPPAATAPLTGPVMLAQPGAPDALTIGDFTGDLRPDLAVVAPGTSSIRLWQSAPSGPRRGSLALAYPTGAYNALASGDLNNDGEDDLVALHGSGEPYRGREVTVYLQRRGAFPSSYTLPVVTGGYLAQSLAVGDVNADGLDDLVVTAGGNIPAAFLNVFLQGPSGLATTPVHYPAYHLPGAVAIGDINHDGRSDVVVAHDGWRTLSIYLQNTAHTLDPYLATAVPYSSYYRPNALTLADFDGNGGLDVGLAGRESGLTVLTNTLALPVAAIRTPVEAAVVPAGTLVVTGTASPDTNRVQVRLKGGPIGWQTIFPVGGVWQATLNLPPTPRSWLIEARAITVSNRVQDPPARRRILADNLCYAVADNSTLQGSPDRLMWLNTRTAEATLMGNTGTDNIHSLAFKPNSARLYTVDDTHMGTLDLSSGSFTPFTATLGSGYRDTNKNKITFSDVKGLAFHPITKALYGVQRRSGSGNKDVLFQIDPATGVRLPSAFGAGRDYVVISSTNALDNRKLDDIDDIAFDPHTNRLYGLAHTGGNNVLITIDPRDGAATIVGPLTVSNLLGLAFTNEGQLLGTTGVSPTSTANRLWKIDKNNASTTLVAQLSAQQDYQGMACLPAGVALPPLTPATAH